MGKIDNAKDPIVLRVEIGRWDERYGIAELHASGEVTLAPSAPQYAQLLYNSLEFAQPRAEQTVEEALYQLPNRLYSNLWARWVDETGREIVPDEEHGGWKLATDDYSFGNADGGRTAIAPEWQPLGPRRRMVEEIYLNEEEEAALDRAWARIRAENEAKRKREQQEQAENADKDESSKSESKER